MPISVSPPRPPLVLKRQAFAPGFIEVTPRSSHLVVIKLARTWLDCRIADRHLQHETRFGTFAILPEAADCSATVDGGVAHTLTLALDVAAFSSFVHEADGRCEPIHILRGEDMALTNLALRLERTNASGGGAHHALANDAIAHDAMAHIATRYARVTQAEGDGTLTLSAMRTIRAFIFDNLASDLTIARLAAVANLSPFHFARGFTRSMGVSPHRYIMQARADQAAASVRMGRRSLADIAYAHGFTDQAHMCRWIRRRYGMTPMALRGARAIG